MVDGCQNRGGWLSESWWMVVRVAVDGCQKLTNMLSGVLQESIFDPHAVVAPVYLGAFGLILGVKFDSMI